jgi:hypothetical protein
VPGAVYANSQRYPLAWHTTGFEMLRELKLYPDQKIFRCE